MKKNPFRALDGQKCVNWGLVYVLGKETAALSVVLGSTAPKEIAALDNARQPSKFIAP
jgi:hypothetical protein